MDGQNSIIITSYNQAKTLELLLTSLDRQTCKDFEVVVADDGSSDRTVDLSSQKWTFPIRFETQPDVGYRKSKILNQALRVVKNDYLIFLDADVILEKHFVEDHVRLRKPRHFVCGRRVDLGIKYSSRIKIRDVIQGKFDCIHPSLLVSALIKDTQSMKRAIRITPFWLRKILGYDRSIDLLGSNFSIWKEDLIQVNGFNEALEAYWGEDGDLYARLIHAGKQPVNAKSMCVQYHVFHSRRLPSKENQVHYERALENLDYKWAVKGLKSNQSE